jgi:hypothetical protein
MAILTSIYATLDAMQTRLLARDDSELFLQKYGSL